MSGKHAFGEAPDAEPAPSLYPPRSFAPEQARSRIAPGAQAARSRPDALPIDIFRLDAAGTILSRHSLAPGPDGQKRSAAPLQGRNCLDVCAEIEMAGNPRVVAVARRLRQLLRGRPHEFECVYVHGGRALRLHGVSTGGAEPALVVVQDITEFRRVSEALADATRRLALVREEERRAVAADLHDTTGQHLVALNFGLSVLERGGANSAVLADMRRELSEAFEEIRTLSYLLYPAALASEGLVASLKELARGYGLRSGVAADLRVRGRLDDLPLKTKQVVLHIVQEALINAHRHAGATRVRISITLGRRGLALRVADDGPGAALKDFTPGVGLRGMRARAAELGGRLSVGPGPSGAVVEALFPASSLGLRPQTSSPA
jgi:signal transduction histidine kinase